MKRALFLVLPVSMLAFAACDQGGDPDDLEPGAQADELADEPGAVASPDAEGRRHGKGHRLANVMAELDADKDGAITKEEAGDHFIAHKFERFDTDGDGRITTEELAAMKGRKKGHRDGHGRGTKTPEERAAHKLERFDADKDGAISLAELGEHPKAEHMKAKFAEIDTDGDGKLVSAELVAWAREHKGRRGHHGKGAPEEAPVAG